MGKLYKLDIDNLEELELHIFKLHHCIAKTLDSRDNVELNNEYTKLRSKIDELNRELDHCNKLLNIAKNKDHAVTIYNGFLEVDRLNKKLQSENTSLKLQLKNKRSTEIQKRIDVDDETLVDMYNNGTTAYELGRLFNMTYHGVRSRLIKYGAWVEKKHGGQSKNKAGGASV